MPRSARPSSGRRLVAVQVDTSTGWGRRLLTGVFQYKASEPALDIWTCPKGFSEGASLPRGLKVDGLIGYVNTAAEARAHARSGLKVVSVSIFDTTPYGIPRIPPDQVSPIELTLGFFRGKGFSHIAYCAPLGLPYIGGYAGRLRARAGEEGFTCAIVDAEDRHLDRALRRLPLPCAILAWSRTAYQLLAACHLAGLKIPEEIAVLSQDEDELLNSFSVPPLSSIRAPATRIGFEAARLLDGLLRGESAPAEPPVIPCTEIIERQSTNSLAIADPHVRNCVHAIQQQAHRPFSVGDLADDIGLSRRTLERRFRQSMGRTIAEEIQRVRLDRAREMLVHTDMPISDVAPRCGFSSVEYFIYVFRRAHDTTPSQYRLKNRDLLAPWDQPRSGP